MNEDSPIRLALVGAGHFARDVHIPSLQALQGLFTIVGIYSRTQARADELAALIPEPVPTYTELSPLLERADVEAVDILLPIHVMPQVVEQALQAGKHVISEKPIAPDVATGRRLLSSYAAHPDRVWMVGENWRYEDAFVQAARLVRAGAIGLPVNVHWSLHLPVKPGSKYHQTTWRRSGTFQGGFLLDGGVHHVAALRLILGEIAEVSAVIRQTRSDLPPADTLAATLRFESGVLGTYLANYAVAAPWPPVMFVAGEAGCLHIERGTVELIQGEKREALPCQKFNAARDEFAAFAATIRRGVPHLNSPEEGLRDLAVVEAMLQSAELGRPVRPEQHGPVQSQR